MNTINFSPSEILFVKANLFNWDNGTFLLNKMLQDEYCDKATALLIYWRCDPGFYYRYPNESEIPEWSLANYRLMKTVEKKLLENKLPELVRYTPDKDRVQKETAVLARIPKELLLPSEGAVDGEFLTSQFLQADYLIDDCRKGNLESVQKRLEANPSIIDLCIEDRTPLIAALEKSRVTVAAYLLEKGASIDAAPSTKSDIPIIWYLYLSKKAKLFELLVEYGADINAVNPVKETVLHRQLNQAPDSWKKNYGPNLLKTMLKLGANLHQKNAAGKTPFDLTKEHNNEEALVIIEKWINDQSKKKNGKS